MIIKLKDGNQLECLSVNGRKLIFQGVERDSLIFSFDHEKVSLSQIESLFNEDNCTKMEFHDEDGSVFIHENYTIRIEYGNAYQSSAVNGYAIMGQNDDDTRVNYVRMAQTTSMERELIEHRRLISMLMAKAEM